MSTLSSSNDINHNNQTPAEDEHQSSHPNNDVSCESPLLKLHYSTIGIGDVFLQPPLPESLPWNYLRTSSDSTMPEIPSSASFKSWEIVGTIKTTPHDFVVREIAETHRSIPGLSPEAIQANQIADLPQVDDKYVSNHTTDPTGSNKLLSQAPEESKHDAIGQKVAMEEIKLTNNEVTFSHRLETSPTIELSPREAMLKILEHVYDTDDDLAANASSIMSSLDQLEEMALNRIRELAEKNKNETENDSCTQADNNNSSTIKTISLAMITSDSSLASPSNTENSSKGGDRGEFHRALRAAFALLKSDTVNFGNDDAHIRISMEDDLDKLIPFLYQPHVDLVRLYRLLHRGYQAQDRPNGGDGGQVALRLLPSLPRERRRDIHALLERACPEMIRHTEPHYPLNKNTDDSAPEPSPQQTAAIILWWSKRAQQQATRKRKRQAESKDTNAIATTTTTRSFPHTLCVMKKYQTEHLTAINHLKSAVRCTPSDIGLAGIKDMQAVTYQFCTFRNVAVRRLANANGRLSLHGMQLGRFYPVDWQLNQGDLYGNRFEIVVRGLRRVQVDRSSTGRRDESLVCCDRQHVMDMVRRIETHGFINFYGDQRVGMPGHTDDIGVRSFDIGRAMLQRNFHQAIDLLMTGRVTCNESEAARKARDIWRKSGGDVALTLSAMPHAIARERAVLQGLKRYGNDNPLAALKCLHFGVRAFWINAYQSYVWNKMATARIGIFGTSVVEGDLYYVGDERNAEIDVVKEGMTDSIQLSQVVLPLPGYNIRYPENLIGDLYRELLRNESVVFERDAPPEATAKGGYRRLVAAVERFTVTVEEGDGASEFVESMKLTFDLKRGMYATSMLRELMVTTIGRDGAPLNGQEG